MSEVKAELTVRFVTLAPMRAASFYGFGPNPEQLAWEKLTCWIEANRLLDDGQEHRFFGFNNPDPSPGSPNYGYEQWVTVGPEIQESEDMKIKEFGGGKYAVTRTTLDKIGDSWMELFTWLEKSPYRFGGHQWLEELLTPDLMQHPVSEEAARALTLDLYMPIVEA